MDDDLTYKILAFAIRYDNYNHHECPNCGHCWRVYIIREDAPKYKTCPTCKYRCDIKKCFVETEKGDAPDPFYISPEAVQAFFN